VTDLSSEFAAAWERFQQLEALHAFGDTLEAEWTQGRAIYLALLIRIEDAAAREYIARVQERLAGIAGLELYPEPYWHATVKGGGFQVIKKTRPDDILRQDVPRIAAKAREAFAREGAFEAQIGPPSGFPEVVLLEVHDGGRIRELNTRVCEALPEFLRGPFDGARFLPHISIARFVSNDGLAELKEALTSLRNEPGPTVQVRRVEFVKVWLSEAMPEFETLATYPLASPAVPPSL
jgi:2'-5' RNA ligase